MGPARSKRFLTRSGGIYLGGDLGGELRQTQKFEANIDYIARFCIKDNIKKHTN